MHFSSDVGQIQRFFNRRVAAADDRDFLVTIEETVAGGAGRDAASFESFFRRQTQITGGSAGSDNQRVTGVLAAVADRRNGRFCRSTLLIWSKIISVSNLVACSCMRSMSSGPVRSFGSRPVFHFSGGGQLTAFSMPVISTGCRLRAQHRPPRYILQVQNLE